MVERIRAKLIDINSHTFVPVEISLSRGKIVEITKKEAAQGAPYLLPGFIDAHIHIESSMLIPSEFARLAVIHGTVATVSDPHEIANVLGHEGVFYMLENAAKTAFKFFFGAPSCVPATAFETAGATLGPAAVEKLLQHPEIWYLAEMMNWPGVLHGDQEVMEKIAIAKKLGKPIDGHAPGLKGEQAAAYAQAGITTDHECFTAEEALDKLNAGMKVIIREGSAARNFEALHPLIAEHFEQMMFCSDDKHPDELLQGHINQLVKRALAKGHDLFKVLQMACLNPIAHYQLPIGSLREGDPADFILIDKPTAEDFKVLKTYISGDCVAETGRSKLPPVPAKAINQFKTGEVRAQDFYVRATSGDLQVIVAKDGELITEKAAFPPKVANGYLVSDTTNDLLKITVVNRYANAKPTVAFIKNFGLKKGAIASTVAHDSHNIIAVGVNDEDLARVVNALVAAKGGLAATDGEHVEVLPLPVAGLMSLESGWQVGAAYASLHKMAKDLGSKLRAPFMALSFMALLVIPSLKLSDKGLFDGESFQFTALQKNGA